MSRFPLFLFLLMHLQSAGQVPATWNLLDSAYGLKGEGVHLYFSDSPLEGQPSRAWYLEVPPRAGLRMQVDTGHGRRITPSSFSARNDTPLALINTTFFSFATSANLNLVVKEGQILAHSPHTAALRGKDSGTQVHYLRSAFGTDRKGRPDITWLYSDSTRRRVYAFQQDPLTVRDSRKIASFSSFRKLARPRRWKAWTAVGGGPVLIWNGRIRITNNEERMFSGPAINDRHPRTAVGYREDGTILLLVVEGRRPGLAAGASLQQLAHLLLQLGCREAMNLDGGGSTCLLVKGQPTNYPSDNGVERPVPAVLMVVRQ